jgi:cytochrome c556
MKETSVLNRFALIVLLATGTAVAADDTVARLKAGQPKPVVELIDRIAACNHWGGEEPYDADRREQIKRAVEKLRCDALERDEAKLLKQFDNNADVRKAIEAAKSASD